MSTSPLDQVVKPKRTKLTLFSRRVRPLCPCSFQVTSSTLNLSLGVFHCKSFCHSHSASLSSRRVSEVEPKKGTPDPSLRLETLTSRADIRLSGFLKLRSQYWYFGSYRSDFLELENLPFVSRTRVSNLKLVFLLLTPCLAFFNLELVNSRILSPSG